MTSLTLTAIEDALREGWGPDTSFATDDYMGRGAGRPARGQCGPTALVVQELIGGDLMVADVEVDGRVEGVHYWNLTSGGVELDLTQDQFVATERLVDPRRVTTPRNPGGAGEEPFQLLRERVRASLGLTST